MDEFYKITYKTWLKVTFLLCIASHLQASLGSLAVLTRKATFKQLFSFTRLGKTVLEQIPLF